MSHLFAIGADPGWKLFAWSALELDERGRPRVLGGSTFRRGSLSDTEWLSCADSVLGYSAALIGTHEVSARGVEDIRGPLNGAQAIGRSNADARNGLLMMGALVTALRAPVALIAPQRWRAALGLPAKADKADAWRTLAALCRCEVKELGSNEHQRDAACIAYAAATARMTEVKRGKR